MLVLCRLTFTRRIVHIPPVLGCSLRGEEIRLVTWVKVSILGKLASGHVDFRQV